MKHKVLFTSDIHGNMIQYVKLINYAREVSPDTIIIGGDIAPKNFSHNTFINGQRRFLEKKLPSFLTQLKMELPESQVFLIMGNDDCATNLDVLIKGEPSLFKVIHGKRTKLVGRFDLIGYPYVPITPFGIKDWEKYDLSQAPSNLANEYLDRKKTDYRLFGVKSAKCGWKQFKFTPRMELKDSIQKDLSNKIFTQKPHKTIYVMHAPPNRTNLDQIVKGYHVGSMALRLFIESNQPYLTLHGHIHETVSVSGKFRDKIGRTVCLSSGNRNTYLSNKLAVLVFDLENPWEAERMVV